MCRQFDPASGHQIFKPKRLFGLFVYFEWSFYALQDREGSNNIEDARGSSGGGGMGGGKPIGIIGLIILLNWCLQRRGFKRFGGRGEPA